MVTSVPAFSQEVEQKEAVKKDSKLTLIFLNILLIRMSGILSL